jgi:hypothetical protein
MPLAAALRPGRRRLSAPAGQFLSVTSKSTGRWSTIGIVSLDSVPVQTSTGPILARASFSCATIA